MPKTRKNKSKDNVVPFNKPKLDKIAEGKLELRQNEQDRLNSIIREKCNEILEIIDRDTSLPKIPSSFKIFSFEFLIWYRIMAESIIKRLTRLNFIFFTWGVFLKACLVKTMYNKTILGDKNIVSKI